MWYNHYYKFEVGGNMPKININVSISNNEIKDSYKLVSIISDNIIKYKEKDNTKVLYNLDKNTLIRENDTLRMEYFFDNLKNTIGTIYLKDLKRTINIDIETTKLEKINNNIDIEYKIDNDIFRYRIEEIEWVYLVN
mgnify:CR=1 FL=1